MTQLSDILLSSSKHATAGWAATTGRYYDILLDDYGAGNWSVACNKDRIDGGTIGWIVRADGSWGHVAGILAITDVPKAQQEPNGVVTYAFGVIFPLPREWWVDGARLNRDGWPSRAPFGLSAKGNRMARFRSGESLSDAAVALIEHRLHPVALDWVGRARQVDI